jgi:hypothetical protein
VLAAGRVEYEVVGVRLRVHPATRGSRLDDMHDDGPKGLAPRLVYQAFQGA